MFESVLKRMFGATGRTSNASQNNTTKTEQTEGNTDDTSALQIDDSQTVLDRIRRLLSEQLMTDVSLVVGGKQYPAHRLILCATSDVFQVMLTKPEWSECRESCVVLQESPECAAVFADFLKYFYTGQIVITIATVVHLLALADKYNVTSLDSVCVKYMINHIAQAATHNHLVSWLQYTSATGHHNIAQECHNFIKWNLEIVALTSDFDNIDHDLLIQLLQQDDIVVYDELSLYNCVSQWLQSQFARIIEENSCENAENIIQNIVYSIMSYVRFPMMSPRQLAELLLNPLTIKYKEFFVDRFAIGMSFHSNQQDRIEEAIRTLDSGKLLFQPRLYTSDSWSTLLTVENFSSLPSYHTCTFVFSSHSTLAEHGGDRLCEWVVDLFPKGIWFKKFLLIVYHGTVEVPERVLHTVRLAITCKDPPVPIRTSNYNVCIPRMRVKVGILISGCQGGVEHIMTVKEKVHHFSIEDKVMNIDDLIPFEELNPPAAEMMSRVVDDTVTSHLVGSQRDTLKMHIVISPISDICCRITEDE